jgi:hypothetical protein
VITIPQPQPDDTQDVRVTFRFDGVHARSAVVAGDFNDWSTSADPMAWDGSGMVANLVLPRGRRYQFRYLVDDVWITDEESDAVAPNGFGDSNSVIDLTDLRWELEALTDAAQGSLRDSEAPADDEPLAAVLGDLERDGFDRTFVLGPTVVTCMTCDSVLEPSGIRVHALRRLEGASDPDDMTAVLAVSCSVCAAKGAIVVPYGPTADDAASALLVGFDDRRDGAASP